MTRIATAKLIAMTCIMVGPVSAGAQPAGMQKALDRKYEILQQQADAETLRAETEAAQAQAQTRAQAAPPAPSTQYTNLPSNDPLAGTNATKCKIANGGGIRVSGTFRPSASTKCE